MKQVAIIIESILLLWQKVLAGWTPLHNTQHYKRLVLYPCFNQNTIIYIIKHY